MATVPGSNLVLSDLILMLQSAKNLMKSYKANTRNDLPRIAEVLGLGRDEVKDMLAVSAVLPFKVNDYILENLLLTDFENTTVMQLLLI